MKAKLHAVDDVLVLKASLMRTANGDRTCRIVGLLPAADSGERQYRVRFGNENFERRILASDIDTTATMILAQKEDPSSTATDGPWLKPGSIRVSK
ncbi:cold-shock protein [Rhizobium sp. LCM 4573]|uniref:cold-shock protein n=1 Tax=Rhizobium sp. LCM 4573 TaxID=1848291 RepID=UPI0008D93483|nr:cold-shock protein [Rhizobium sp. LCM 4573]OHV79002.1 cold-shock protein [Rhizobium sp. LCM 4573]